MSGSSTPEDGLYGSWVELEELISAVSSRDSLTGQQQDTASWALQGELERILLEAQLECERSKDRSVPYTNKNLSPPLCVCVCVCALVCVCIHGCVLLLRSPVDLLSLFSPPLVVTPPQTTASPPHSEGSSSTDCVTIQSEEEGERRLISEWVWDWSSRPENLPPKEFVFQHQKQQSGSLSVRKSEVMKRGLFSSDVLMILIPSLLASHLLTLGVGIYIGKRLAASTTSTL
uniref:Zgc:73226 n=1 Tax=Hucho hucho TaxID=62062 RepID=A0A4W5MBE4_9TELE